VYQLLINCFAVLTVLKHCKVIAGVLSGASTLPVVILVLRVKLLLSLTAWKLDLIGTSNGASAGDM